MSVQDSRCLALIEQYIGNLQSPYEDVRRRATDELYERIVAQYADVSYIKIFNDLVGNISMRFSRHRQTY